MKFIERAVPTKYEKILLFPRSVKDGRWRSKRFGCENNFEEKGNGARAAAAGRMSIIRKSFDRAVHSV